MVELGGLVVPPLPQVRLPAARKTGVSPRAANRASLPPLLLPCLPKLGLVVDTGPGVAVYNWSPRTDPKLRTSIIDECCGGT